MAEAPRARLPASSSARPRTLAFLTRARRKTISALGGRPGGVGARPGGRLGPAARHPWGPDAGAHDLGPLTAQPTAAPGQGRTEITSVRTALTVSRADVSDARPPEPAPTVPSHGATPVRRAVAGGRPGRRRDRALGGRPGPGRGRAADGRPERPDAHRPLRRPSAAGLGPRWSDGRQIG